MVVRVQSYSFLHPFMAESQEEEEINDSPIEQVRLTVPPTDDPTLPVLTIRTWVLGMTACVFLAFTQQFFAYRQNPINIPTVCIDILVLAGGKLMARLLPAKLVRVQLTGGWSFSLNPGPFNVKEHVLISLLANSGASYSEGVTVITMMRVFYKRSLQPLPSFLLVLSTAGTHEPEERQNGGLTRLQFFVIVSVSSFAYYLVPSYFFPSISALSFVCWIWKDSVTAQQIGSGFHGLGVGSFALDWTTVSTLGNPLAAPVFTIFNMMAGLTLALYVVTPLSYWTNTYNARRFLILSSNVFDADGQIYNISRILDEKTLKFNEQAYNNYSKLYFSSNFAYHYGFNFAFFTASVSHTILFYRKSVWNQFRQANNKQDEDIHTKLMKQNYEPLPQWWFYAFLISMLGLGIFACEGFGKQLQLSYWGIILACVVVLILLLPNGILEATSGLGIRIEVLLEMIMGYISPGKPIANITFQVYGLMSYAQASFFIANLKLGLYIKIPPKLMFLVQVLGSVVTCTINYFMVRWLRSSVKNICHPELLPKGSPWTCPYEILEYNFGVTWGVVGPHKMFYPDGTYSGIFIFLLIGFLVPVPVWILSCIYPNKKWIKLINFPLMFGAATRIPPATAVSFWCWLVVSILFNVVVYGKYKGWWSSYNYLLGSGLDAGVAFMVLLASISLNAHGIFGINWWGLSLDDHCPLAKCPTAPDIVVEGCPIIW